MVRLIELRSAELAAEAQGKKKAEPLVSLEEKQIIKMIKGERKSVALALGGLKDVGDQLALLQRKYFDLIEKHARKASADEANSRQVNQAHTCALCILTYWRAPLATGVL